MQLSYTYFKEIRMHPLLTKAAEAPPSIKWIASIVGALSVIIGTAFAVDGRYVHADDFKTYQESQDTNSQKTQNSIYDVRKANLEDKIFELELKERRTNNENALLNHYKQQLHDINWKLKDNQP
jgi:predicted acyl esterase